MNIDDKYIGHKGFTILINNDTGKIAMMIESTTANELESVMGKFSRQDLQQIKTVSMDMNPIYALVFNGLIPYSEQIIDKFRVMQYVYDAIGVVRKRKLKEMQSQLSKEKKRNPEGRSILAGIELLRRVSHAITQSSDKWNDEMKKTIYQLFFIRIDLKIVYQISQDFKHWYVYGEVGKSIEQIKPALCKWYEIAWNIEEIKETVKMLRKHEDEILNFFKHGRTNVKAERLNGKIQRFISNNFGLKDKVFFLFRTAGYFL
ncbi:MAG: transposase [Bacteroidales bacterium]|jgi:transposase|nr:transposase [Bacteroidales bacterium]